MHSYIHACMHAYACVCSVRTYVLLNECPCYHLNFSFKFENLNVVIISFVQLECPLSKTSLYQEGIRTYDWLTGATTCIHRDRCDECVRTVRMYCTFRCVY